MLVITDVMIVIKVFETLPVCRMNVLPRLPLSHNNDDNRLKSWNGHALLF